MTRAIANSWPTPFHFQTVAWDNCIFVDDGGGCCRSFDDISISQNSRCVLNDIASKDGDFIPLLSNGNNFSYFPWSRTPIDSTSKLTLVVFFIIHSQMPRSSNQWSKRFRRRRDSPMSRPIRRIVTWLGHVCSFFNIGIDIAHRIRLHNCQQGSLHRVVSGSPERSSLQGNVAQSCRPKIFSVEVAMTIRILMVSLLLHLRQMPRLSNPPIIPPTPRDFHSLLPNGFVVLIHVPMLLGNRIP
mmetsp:Transcript_10596/g.19138  ORF Transcript_10596/g.19138 Transcript_10596/m.19138 type:complete len:242 (-) Transcript_10596:1877-2602(-)